MNKHYKQNKYLSPYTIAMLIVLIVYVASLLYMYIWGFFTSLKTVRQFKTDMLWLPEGAPWEWEWNNYVVAYNNFESQDIIGPDGIPYRIGFVGMFVNTLVYSLIPPFITLAFTWGMAYICSQFKYMWSSKFIVSLNLILMMIPVVGTGPSALQIWKALNLYDTWGWVFINSIGFVGSNFIIFYAYLRTIATEMREAALIDGAGNWTIMLRIIFPLTINMFSILFVMAFIARWNDYMTMVVWLPSKPSLAYGVYRFSTNVSSGLTWPTIQVSACMILMLPVLALFIILKDKILGGITISTLK